MRKSSRGFTLIELLIVVAIIAILAAIAVPNFLEAQTRAKTSRVLADMRTLKTALEAYAVDYGDFPRVEGNMWYVDRYRMITTPVAYITAPPFDVFGDAFAPEFPRGINGQPTGPLWVGHNWPEGDPRNPTGLFDMWVKPADAGPTWYNFPYHAPQYRYQLRSFGPDQNYGGNMRYYGQSDNQPSGLAGQSAVQVPDDSRLRGIVIPYDPSNGTVSVGDIMMFGPGGGVNDQI